MRVRYFGTVERVQPQPSRRGETFPTLIHVRFEGLPSMMFQAPPADGEAALVGQGVVLTLDIDEPKNATLITRYRTGEGVTIHAAGERRGG